MENKYESSLFYQINSSAKYFDMLFDQFLKNLNAGISAIECLALGVIMQTSDCCQRDLAKIILKDRANTGKLALKLEKKGLIKINLKSKNNKPVKILTLTDKGKKLYDNIMKKMKPLGKEIRQQAGEENIEKMVEGLKNFRQLVKKIVKINI